jgi:uncharacterized protein YndB with AHSA1/START domain
MAETKIIAVPGKYDLQIVREFNAPRELVFRAHTEPELYARWIAPRSHTTTVEALEARWGGRWRFVSRDDEGNEYAFRGVVHAVEAPARIVQTFEFEGTPGHVQLETATFEELPGGRCRYTGHSVFQSVEDRDGMIGAGMEVGVTEGYEKLDELLAELVPAA